VLFLLAHSLLFQKNRFWGIKQFPPERDSALPFAPHRAFSPPGRRFFSVAKTVEFRYYAKNLLIYFTRIREK
jgi:hypothetical protein